MAGTNAIIKANIGGVLTELYPKTTIDNVDGLNTLLSEKVDKVTGKGLSDENYTTIEKNKLLGIETNANNYVHPTTSGNKHIPSGGSSGKILGWSADGTAAWVDPASGGGSVDTVYIGSTEYAPDANGKVTLPTYPTTLPASDVYSWAKASSKPSYTASEVGAIATTAKGANNGVAELDSSGKVPSSQLPSYVDDVLEYSAKSSFPATGETGKIYVDTSTNLTYRWSGSAYTEISPSLALGETSSTAYRGDRGKDAYNHATDSSRLTTATASGLYKVASTSEGHIASLTAVAKSDITSLGIPSSDTNTYVSSASFDDNTSSSTANPLKMTLSRSGSLTTSVTATLPKVSSSTAGVVPKGASVSSQSQSTKFLREDGSWAVPSYSSSSTFSISRYSSSYTVNGETWKSNGMAWFTIVITNSSQINANTSTIPAYVPSDLKPKGSRDINLVCDVDNKYCRAWITGGSQYIYIRPLENIPANSNIRISGCYPY